MKEYTNKIFITGLTSAGLLISFFILQYLQSDLLNLDVKWIVVSAIPVIIGLILSGIVKSVKGFGVELEMNLSEKVELELIGKVECLPTTELTKQSIDHLHEMHRTEKMSIERLQLISGKRDYYDSYAIGEYIGQLVHLKYIEIIDYNGRFQALLKVNQFRHKSRNENIQMGFDANESEIKQLIKSLEVENHMSVYRKEVITESILKDDSLVTAYKKFQNARLTIESFGDQQLPVLDSNNRMVGITSRVKLVDKIAQQVIKSEK